MSWDLSVLPLKYSDDICAQIVNFAKDANQTTEQRIQAIKNLLAQCNPEGTPPSLEGRVTRMPHPDPDVEGFIQYRQGFIEDLKKVVEQYQKECQNAENMKQEMEKTQEQFKTLSAEHTLKKEECDRLKQEHAHSLERLEDLNRRYTASQDLCQRLSQQQEQLRAQAQDLSNRHLEAQANYERLQRDQAGLKEESTGLQGGYERSQRIYQELGLQRQQLETSLADLQNRYRESQSACEELRRQKDELQNASNDLNTRYLASQAAYQQLTDRRYALEGKIGWLEGEWKRLFLETLALAGKIKWMYEEIDRLNQKYGELQSQFQNLVQKNKALEDQLVDDMRKKFIYSQKLGHGTAVYGLLGTMAVASLPSPASWPALPVLGGVALFSFIKDRICESKKIDEAGVFERLENQYRQDHPNASKKEVFEHAKRKYEELCQFKNCNPVLPVTLIQYSGTQLGYWVYNKVK